MVKNVVFLVLCLSMGIGNASVRVRRGYGIRTASAGVHTANKGLHSAQSGLHTAGDGLHSSAGTAQVGSIKFVSTLSEEENSKDFAVTHALGKYGGGGAYSEEGSKASNNNGRRIEGSSVHGHGDISSGSLTGSKNSGELGGGFGGSGNYGNNKYLESVSEKSDTSLGGTFKASGNGGNGGYGGAALGSGSGGHSHRLKVSSLGVGKDVGEDSGVFVGGSGSGLLEEYVRSSKEHSKNLGGHSGGASGVSNKSPSTSVIAVSDGEIGGSRSYGDSTGLESKDSGTVIGGGGYTGGGSSKGSSNAGYRDKGLGGGLSQGYGIELEESSLVGLGKTVDKDSGDSESGSGSGLLEVHRGSSVKYSTLRDHSGSVERGSEKSVKSPSVTKGSGGGISSSLSYSDTISVESEDIVSVLGGNRYTGTKNIKSSPNLSKGLGDDLSGSYGHTLQGSSLKELGKNVGEVSEELKVGSGSKLLGHGGGLGEYHDTLGNHRSSIVEGSEKSLKSTSVSDDSEAEIGFSGGYGDSKSSKGLESKSIDSSTLSVGDGHTGGSSLITSSNRGHESKRLGSGSSGGYGQGLAGGSLGGLSKNVGINYGGLGRHNGALGDYSGSAGEGVERESLGEHGGGLVGHKGGGSGERLEGCVDVSRGHREDLIHSGGLWLYTGSRGSGLSDEYNEGFDGYNGGLVHPIGILRRYNGDLILVRTTGGLRGHSRSFGGYSEGLRGYNEGISRAHEGGSLGKYSGGLGAYNSGLRRQNVHFRGLNEGLGGEPGYDVLEGHSREFLPRTYGESGVYFEGSGTGLASGENLKHNIGVSLKSPVKSGSYGG